MGTIDALVSAEALIDLEDDGARILKDGAPCIVGNTQSAQPSASGLETGTKATSTRMW